MAKWWSHVERTIKKVYVLCGTKKKNLFKAHPSEQQRLEQHGTLDFLKLMLKMARLALLSFWHKHRIASRLSAVFLLLILLVSLYSEIVNTQAIEEAYTISDGVANLLTQPIPTYAQQLIPDPSSGEILYNQNYIPAATELAGDSSSPRITARFGHDSVTVNDPLSNVGITLTHKLAVREPRKNTNKVVYPLIGQSAQKIYTLGATGVKEDIVFEARPAQDEMIFEYTLGLAEGLEARLESDGSLGVYGVESVLLGDVTTTTDSDAELLAQARDNAAKNQLIFVLPAPFVVEQTANNISDSVVAEFELDGDRLLLKVAGLHSGEYPLSIDPTIYVDSARKLMRGNNESNIDFDIANELIQKSQTTGARIDEWTETMDMDSAFWANSVAAAGGYVYAVGGKGEVSDPVAYSTPGTSTFVVPAGVSSVTIKTWGAGGGGGGGGLISLGGEGGAGAFAEATLAVSAGQVLDIYVGGAGGAGLGSAGGFSGDGGGGGGSTKVSRSGSTIIIAAGGGGAGGGDNSSAINGGAGGAGGTLAGVVGGASSAAGGGAGGAASSGGAGGVGVGNVSDGTSGGSEVAGDGGDGAGGSSGSANNGGQADDGDGGDSDLALNGYAGGGGGGGGFFGGGGGSSSVGGNAGGGGGGGGSSFVSGTDTSAVVQLAGSGTVPGNDADPDRAGAGGGGLAGPVATAGSAGSDGRVVVTYAASTSTAQLQWAEFDDQTSVLKSPNPGAGPCIGWCTESAYQLPEERIGASMVAYNGFLYVIGGTDDVGVRQSTVYIAKLGANGEPQLWHPVDDDQSNWVYWYNDSGLNGGVAKSYTSAVAYNGRMYVVGGQTDALPGGVSAVEVAEVLPNGILGSWSTTGMEALPSSAGYHMHSVHVYNDVLYTIGGFNGAATSSANLTNTVHYAHLNSDGTMNPWIETESFVTARATFGGSYSTIWGAYIYVGGGCSAVNASGYCTTVADDVQLASINADGSIGRWDSISNLTNQRLGYTLLSWQGGLYRISGCSSVDVSTGDCVASSVLSDVDYGVINPSGEVSTVNVTEASGFGNCVGSAPMDCDIPPAGDGAGQGGQMLSASTILNGHLYVIGGCVTLFCEESSGNVSYVSISSDGSLEAPSSCSGTSYGAWCVDSTNRVNGTSGVSAAGVTTFNNRIYIVGGIDETLTGTQRIYYNDVNVDGSLDGSWEFVSFTAAGITTSGDETGEKAYTYSFTRANPAAAATNPGNLYVVGGCSAINANAGCQGAYNSSVYKCNIANNGSVNGCSTNGQLQLDVELATEANQGLGLHSGTVYANYVYLVGGYSVGVADRDTIFYAAIDDNNNIVDVDSGTADLGNDDDDWIESDNSLLTGRRRGWAFGYNGHVYAVGGFDLANIGTISSIEWSKVDVSDGSIDPFNSSKITIIARWGLSMVVSNSYAYVIGGCDMGASPAGCTSFEPSVQTFQLYNNNSGTPVGYQDTDTLFANDRYGTSAAVLDGNIYVAGGCNDDLGDCSSTTSSVQYARLDASGNIGPWKATTGLPASLGWGQLETAGGSLYWIGGQDSSGNEQSNVYHATPRTTAGTQSDVIRTTQYKLDSGAYTGQTYTLTLNNDLMPDYFVMVSGAVDVNIGRAADESQIRVDGDPFGSLTTTTSPNQLRFTRGPAAVEDWNGAITVVECLSSCATDGFELKEVLDVPLAAAAGPGTLVTEYATLSEDYSNNTVPFGGYLGGGLSTDAQVNVDFSPTSGVRIQRDPSDSGRLAIERYGADGRTPAAATLTIYIVEWGSEWSVQESHFENWQPTTNNSTLDTGCNSTSPDFFCNTINTVSRDNTWVWKSPGTSTGDGSGDGPFGKVVTIGDGVAEGMSEMQVAIGSQRIETYRDTVYVLEHASINVDHRRDIIPASPGAVITELVDAAVNTETYSTSGNVAATEGYRFPLLYYATNTTSNMARTAGYGHYHTAPTIITAEQNFVSTDPAYGWWQSVDFGSLSYNPEIGDIDSWSAASFGLPNARAQFGAASWNDRLYVVAGVDATGNESNTVYISPQLSAGGDITSSWATETTNVPEVARSGNTVVAYANNLYSFGGYDGSNYLLDSQFTQINADGTVDDWSFTTPLPNPVRQADSFAANGYMYVVGGRSADNACISHTYVAPISANTTIATGNNPTGLGEWYETNQRYSGNRYGNAVAYNNGRLYLLGGTCVADFPDIIATAESTFDTVSLGHNVMMPAVVGAGDLLVAVVTNDGNATVTTPSGWTQISTATNGTAARGSVFAKAADGSEGGTQVSFVTSIAEEMSAIVVRISASDWRGGSVASAVEAVASASTSVTPNSSALNPTNWGSEDTLWMSYIGASSYDSVVAYPANYTELSHIQSSSGINGTSASLSYRENATTAEDPGAYTMNASENAVNFTIAVRPNSNNAFTDSSRVTQTALLSQPQIAQYSRLIDTDSNVFPNSFLLNGIDNAIGARWSVRYRSAVDAQQFDDVKTVELTNFQDNSQNFREIDFFDENNNEVSYVADDGGSMGYFSGTGLSRINDGNINTSVPDDYQVHPINAIGRTITMTFASPVQLNNAVFYNRTGCCKDRIGGTSMIFKNEGGDVLFEYVFPLTGNGNVNTIAVNSSGWGWGLETDFGDVTLGDVNPYIPLSSSGTNTQSARYYYLWVEIDASQTFGYPEDVERGPTLADLSLFFTADPNKRLRHGKTFTGGEQQPLDTPCRQNVDPDCPLPAP